MKPSFASARRSLRRCREGGAAIEFAIVFPLLVTLLFGIFQIGVAYHNAGTVRYGLERAMRQVFLNPNLTAQQLEDALRGEMAGSPISGRIDVALRRETVNGVVTAVGETNYTAEIVIPLLGAIPVRFDAAVTVPIVDPP